MPTPDHDAPDGSGRLIGGRYRLESRIGGGAMGTVWSAVDELLRRPVAVKELLLAPGMPEEEAAELRERALREARAIAALSHPNVVTLYDVAREQDEPFVVMELVPSQSLGTIVDNHGALSDQQLAVITEGVAAGLDAAHHTGIIHRDVKPGNVLIGDDGRIKLSDFGISRNIAEATMTRTGIMLGTPAYIAPEIASGDRVTTAADLWGLGATLFAAAEGRPPYDAGEALPTVSAVVNGPVPHHSRSGPIGEIISGLMVKEPGLRLSLTDARRRIQHLLPEPGDRPFETFLDPEAPTVRVRRPSGTARDTGSSQTGHPHPGPAGHPHPGRPTQPEQAAPLASDPGIPPFPLRDPPPVARRRSPWAVISLALASLIVFAAGLSGGFAASRGVAGQPPLPKAPASSRAAAPAMVRYQDNARHTSDSGGDAPFGITVPDGWTLFHGERDDPTNSLTVSYVSPDGRREISVERFGGFYRDGYTLDDYLKALPQIASGSQGQFVIESDAPSGGGSHEGDRRLLYHTAEPPAVDAGGPALQRTTIAQVMPRGDDLWILRVTVPGNQSAVGQALFSRTLPSFSPPS